MASLGLQLVVRIPLGDVGDGVPRKERPPPRRLTPAKRSGGRQRGIGHAVGARERAVRGRRDGAGAGGGAGAAGAGGAGLTGAAGQAAVSQAGLRTPTMEGEGDEVGAGELT